MKLVQTRGPFQVPEQTNGGSRSLAGWSEDVVLGVGVHRENYLSDKQAQLVIGWESRFGVGLQRSDWRPASYGVGPRVRDKLRL